MAGKPEISAAPSKERPPFNREKYNEVVDSAKLLTIQVTKTAFNVAPEFYDGEIKKTLKFEHQEIDSVFDPDENVVIGRFRFGCEATSRRKSVLKSTAEYIVMYEVHDGAEQNAVETFCARVGVFAAYPYYRALVAHLGWAANAKLPPLPVIATKGSVIAAVTGAGDRPARVGPIKKIRTGKKASR